MRCELQGRLHPAWLHGQLRGSRPLPTVRGALWGRLIRAAALVAILLAAGCGGSGESGGPGDPAGAVPADAAVYVELVVRPSGSVREDALAAASKVLSTDEPEARIRALVERFVKDVDYARDIEPWLGERAALWSEPSGQEAPVVVLATTDADAARESLAAGLARAGHEVSERSYRGREYLLGESGGAAGVVDSFVIAGREAQFKRSVDAVEGSSLAESDSYAEVVDDLPEERLGVFWADSAALFELAFRDEPLSSVVPTEELPPVAGAFLADGSRLAVEARVPGGIAARGTPLIGELPGDSWLAFAAADVGSSVRDGLDRFAGALGGVAIRGQVLRETGLDLDRDLLDWIGDAGVFVRGTSPGAIDGGIVIRPTDMARAEDAFGRIVGAVAQAGGAAAEPIEIEGADQAFAFEASPERMVLARGSERVVLAVGEAAAEAALGTGDTLGETDVYAEGEELVGMEPTLLVAVPGLLSVVDDEARRHLEPFSVIAAGAEEDEARLAAGLR